MTPPKVWFYKREEEHRFHPPEAVHVSSNGCFRKDFKDRVGIGKGG